MTRRHTAFAITLTLATASAAVACALVFGSVATLIAIVVGGAAIAWSRST